MRCPPTNLSSRCSTRCTARRERRAARTTCPAAGSPVRGCIGARAVGMTGTVVACCQVTLAVGDAEGNRRRMRDAVRRSAAAGAQVIVLPELANSGYVLSGATEARGLAETLDGPTVQDWRQLAVQHRLLVVGGLCRRDRAGGLRNSAVLVDATGVRAAYDKAHLWDREHAIFTPGDRSPAVVDTAVGRIAMMICYDLEFPEWTRLAALAGAELLCVPTNWTACLHPARERPLVLVKTQAAAASNHMFVAAANRAGTERGTEWAGASVIIAPDGWPAAGPAPQAAGSVTAACDLAVARDKRISPHNDVLADRRTNLYAALSTRGDHDSAWRRA